MSWTKFLYLILVISMMSFSLPGHAQSGKWNKRQSNDFEDVISRHECKNVSFDEGSEIEYSLLKLPGFPYQLTLSKDDIFTVSLITSSAGGKIVGCGLSLEGAYFCSGPAASFNIYADQEESQELYFAKKAQFLSTLKKIRRSLQNNEDGRHFAHAFDCAITAVNMAP